MRQPFARRTTVVALVAWLAATGSALAQSQAPIRPFGFDFTQFLFKQQGIEFTTLPSIRGRASDSIIVALGEVTPALQAELMVFARYGGAVLVATDRATPGGGLLSIGRGPVESTDPATHYQGYSDCFRVQIAEHELSQGVREIIVNRTGSIRWLNTWTWKTLATLPTRSQPVFLAVHEARGGGRIAVMADHSPFTNDMLMHGDNAIFVVNMINWLTKGDKKQIVFLVDGRYLGSPNMPSMLPPDSIPPIDPDDIPEDTKIALANRFLREVQRDNALNRFLASVPPRYFWRWIILLPTLVMAFLVLRRLLSSERSLVKPPELHASNASEARTTDMLRSGSMQSVGRELARGLLRTLTNSSSPAAWAVSGKNVEVSPEAGVSPRRVRSDVEWLGRLATGADKRRMKKRALRKLVRRIDELTMLHARGQLRLQSVAATT